MPESSVRPVNRPVERHSGRGMRRIQVLRIPFSAWVDISGGRKPFLTLLSLSVVGMAGLAGVVAFFYPNRMTPGMYPVMLILALLCGCGIATFSVGAGQTAYWFPQKKHCLLYTSPSPR